MLAVAVTVGPPSALVALRTCSAHVRSRSLDAALRRVRPELPFDELAHESNDRGHGRCASGAPRHSSGHGLRPNDRRAADDPESLQLHGTRTALTEASGSPSQPRIAQPRRAAPRPACTARHDLECRAESCGDAPDQTLSSASSRSASTLVILRATSAGVPRSASRPAQARASAERPSAAAAAARRRPVRAPG